MEMITPIKEYWEPDRSQIFMTKLREIIIFYSHIKKIDLKKKDQDPFFAEILWS